MTLKEFFRKARRGRKWRYHEGEVRCADGYCPLGAVMRSDDPTPEIGAASKALGLRVATASKIADAADGWSKDRDLKWLLKNLGVRAVVDSEALQK